MIRFLGSVYFAILLIFISLVAVIIGTVLEAKTGSHDAAEQTIYGNVFFHALLAGYFLNIFISMLSRWPFKKKHIPFLMTHVGLLMIISGIFVKMRFGVQGHIDLIEGAASNHIEISGEKALFIKPLGKETPLFVPIEQVEGSKLIPSVKVSYEAFLDGDALDIRGLEKTPLKDLPTPATLPDGKTVLLAKKGDRIDDFPFPPLFIHDGPDEIALSTFDEDGEEVVSSHAKSLLKEWISYGGGHFGYTLETTLPYVTKEDQKKRQEIVKKALRDELVLALNHPLFIAPPIRFLFLSSELSKEAFADLFIDALYKIDQSGKTLPAIRFPFKIDLLLLDEKERAALYWIATVFKEEGFYDFLLQSGFPNPSQHEFLPFASELYAAKDALPDPLVVVDENTKSKMAVAYLKLYQIELKNLPKPNKSAGQLLHLESRLRRIVQETPEGTPESVPGLHLPHLDLTIPFDKEGKELKWNIQAGNTLLGFTPFKKPLPFTVALSSAKEIKYPGTNKTASYEADVTLLEDGKEEIAKLSMNEVHETASGYRLYLSGMGAIDRYGVKQVRLVVNRDPARWWLTYPGGVLVACGIILLFWRKS